MYWIEVRSTLKRINYPKLYALDKSDKLIGFRSVYAFDDKVKDFIINKGNTLAISNLVPVYSDVLFIDFDDAYAEAEKAIKWIKSNNYKAYIYDSGNRSIHIHIPIVPMEGITIAKVQRTWVSSKFPRADLSFYNSSGIFRLPDTIHLKTGRRKKLIETIEGQTLQIDIISNTPKVKLAEDQEGILQRFTMNLITNSYKGNRKIFIGCFLTKDAYQLGLSEDECFDYLSQWNYNFCHPMLDENTIWTKIREVYK